MPESEWDRLFASAPAAERQGLVDYIRAAQMAPQGAPMPASFGSIAGTPPPPLPDHADPMAPTGFAAMTYPQRVAMGIMSLPYRAGAGTAQGLYQAATLGGRALRGEIGRPDEIDPQQAISEALNFAGNVAGGDLIGAKVTGQTVSHMDPSKLGMFAGAKAKTADLDALRVAQDMEAAGTSADRVWQATGWGRGKDGQWRFEIDDRGAQYKKNPDAPKPPSTQSLAEQYFAEKTGKPGFAVNSGQFPDVASEAYDYAYGHIDEAKKAFKGEPVSNVLEHGDLYAAYPEMSHIPTGLERDPFLYGHFDGKNIFYGGGIIGERLPPGIIQDKSTLLHELQHAVQRVEGFGYGANTEQPFYKQAAGEVEARNVQKRQLMSAEARRNLPPWASEDVPRAQQVITRSSDYDR